MLKPYRKAEISFEYKEEIGQEGANSNAFLAHDKQLDADIVIKQVKKAGSESLETFFEEARILYLSSHPNVVQVHYACEDDDYVYIGMPYYKAGSLKKLIDTQFLTLREIVRFGCQISSGLHNIHSKGLIHFDIKPDNVLLSDRGEALLSDFGLSRRINLSGIAGQDRLYLKMRPPEAFSTTDFTRAFDIYQLGLTLYRMCVGNQEFDAQFSKFGDSPDTFKREDFKYAVRNGKFPDRSVYPAHIPNRMRNLIKACLETEVSKRMSAAIDVANGLAEIDSRLDWRYSVEEGAQVWRREVDGKLYVLQFNEDGSSYAQKTVGSGKPKRIVSYCKDSISLSEIKSFLKEQEE
jgi:eukaryotic-like serine/threonine-protein kinase